MGFRQEWHHLDHVYTVCTSLQRDNHINTASLNFYGAGALLDTQPTASKLLKATLLPSADGHLCTVTD